MEWKEVRLGDLCKQVCSGGTPKSTNNAYYGGSIPWLNTKEINFNRIYSTEKTITEDGLNNSSAKWIEANTVTIAMYGATAGKSCIVKVPLTTNQACCNLTIDNEKADYELIYYALKNLYTELASLANGGAQQNLNAQIIKDFIIKLPSSIDDQHRIASILSSLDSKIETNNKINAKLEEIAQALFKSWFVDFEPFKDGKFVESELGMIPEGWRVGKLTEIIRLMSGGTPKTSEPSYWENGIIPFFSPKDVNGIYCFDTEKHITEAGLNKCSSSLYPKDTIFITCRGTVGKVVMCACDMAMNLSNYAIKADKGYTQYFVFYLVRSLVERLIKKANGAVFSAITSKDFDEMVVLPSLEHVKVFTSNLSPILNKIHSNSQENLRLSQLRDTLLPKLVNGEIEI